MMLILKLTMLARLVNECRMEADFGIGILNSHGCILVTRMHHQEGAKQKHGFGAHTELPNSAS